MKLDFLPPSTPAAPEMEVRELTADEVQSYVKPKYDDTGNPLPDPRISTFSGVL